MDLHTARVRINAIDTKMVELFAERMRAAAEIAAAKAEQGLPVLDAGREEQVLERVTEQAGETLAPYIRTLYQTMFAVSRDYQAALLSAPSTREKHSKILVINGPNLNMLGIREKNIYGTETYADLRALLEKAFAKAGVSGEIYQSNHEGDLVDRIQRAYFDGMDGIVINPAAYTHTSVAVLDALKAVSLPTVEVHISALEEREDFRQISYAGKACVKTIIGRGLQGYVDAVAFLADHIKSKDEPQKK